MKKSICVETIFTEAPFEERFALAKEAGFDCVELWTWKDKDIAKIKQLSKQNGLTITSFSGDKDYSLVAQDEAEDYVNFLMKSIDTAIELECKNLVVHSNALGEGGVVLNSYPEISKYRQFGTLVNILKELAPIVEEKGVNLVLETLNTKIDHAGNFLAYTKDTTDAVRLVNSPNIKILYDIYHMQIMEGNIIDTINTFIDLIGYIHIADVPGRHEPGTGEINYQNVMEALRNNNYGGYIGFELFPIENSDKAIHAISRL